MTRLHTRHVDRPVFAVSMRQPGMADYNVALRGRQAPGDAVADRLGDRPTAGGAAEIAGQRRAGLDDRLTRAGAAVADAVAAIVSRGAPLTADLVGADAASPRSLVARTIREATLAQL